MKEQIIWTFFFEGDPTSNAIIFKPQTQEEDERVLHSIDVECMLTLNTDKYDLFINMCKVKCISRVVEQIQQEQPNIETPPSS